MDYDPAPVNEYIFTSEDRLLLDTNVWLLVYGPQKPGAADARVPVYSNAVKRILNAGSSVCIDGLMDEYSLGKSDFNDQVLRELCKKKGLTLLTDDSDFRETDIPVLTGNGELLQEFRSGR